MEEIVRGVVAQMTDEYSYIKKGRLEALVYICLCERDGEAREFERNRFGVVSDRLDAVIRSCCNDGVFEEVVRVTFGGEPRYEYRITDSFAGEIDEVVREVCEEYGDVPISNLHSMASDHSW